MPYNRFTILILFIIFASCSPKPALQRNNYPAYDGGIYSLSGNIKQITTEPADDQPTPNPGQDYHTAYFDKRGNVYKTIDGFHGMVSQTHYFTIYDKRKNKLATLGYFRHTDFYVEGDLRPPLHIGKNGQPENDLQLKEIYRYNDHKQIVNYVTIGYRRSPDSSFYNYKYNNRGLLIELDDFVNPTVLGSLTKFKYDNDDNLTESDEYQQDRLRIKIVYQYKLFDSKGNWTRMITHTTGDFYGSNGENYIMKREISYY